MTRSDGSTPDRPWWKSAVFYQIYPRSFADASGDGVGDLAGIAKRVDHLVDLGVDAVWLSPFYESPMRDFGYDVSDHCAVDPVFGSMDDFDRLVAALHERGIRLIVDFVPNHTSSDHPWFVESSSSVDNPKRDWYLWADPNLDGGPPTNWTAAFTEESAWEFDEASGQYYLHLFLPSQPDLNWENPQVEAAMHDVLRFWIDRGVDGFRMDVISAIGKDPEPRDVPAKLVGLPHVVLTHHDTAMPLIRRIRRTVDPDGDRVVVGEVVTYDLAQQAAYAGAGDGICIPVNFASVATPWDAARWRELISSIEEAYPADGPNWPSYVLSNHDVVRHRTRFGGDEARARAAAVLLLTLRGTPFVYQGEELGLEDAVVTGDDVVDPGGRDGCRAPIPWEVDAGHGWEADPWLPFSPDSGPRSAEGQRADPTSVLALYWAVLGVRRGSPALQLGTLELLDTGAELLSYRRSIDGDDRVVHVNFGDAPAEVPAGGQLVVSSLAGRSPGSFDGRLGPAEAVVVVP